MMLHNELMGTRIRIRRQELKMTQKELAEKVGYTSHTTVAKVESGLVDLPQSKILAFADALDTTPQWLMYGNGTEKKPVYLEEEDVNALEYLRNDPDLRMLLSASSKLNADDIRQLIQLAERMNRE